MLTFISPIPLCTGIVLYLLPAAAGADIYHGIDNDGVPSYSDRPRTGYDPYLPVDDLPGASLMRKQSPASFGHGMRKHAPLIATVAAATGLEPALLHAIVQVESGYDATAVSPKGAIGLMQLMPATARQLGVADPRNPLDNLRGGARYLQRLKSEFGGNLSLALAAYNAGEGAVRAHAYRVPPYAETTAYVTAVLRRYEALAGRL